MNFNSSELPNGCGEIEATAHPGDEMLLEDHIDDLPGMTQGRVDQLSRVALRAQTGSWGRGPGTTMLQVNDLLRRTSDDRVALHPRVVQFVSLSSIDSLIRAIGGLFDAVPGQSACQYPDTIIECRGGNPDKDALYPPEYNLKVADIARRLREARMLTSIRHPGESRLPIEERRSVVEALESEGIPIIGSVTVHQPSDESQPQLYVDRFTTQQAPPSAEDFRDICLLIFHQCGLRLELIEDSDWGDSSL